MRHDMVDNVAISAAKILKLFRIAKQTRKMPHIMRRFYQKNVGNILQAQRKKDLFNCEQVL
jgi:hypothetical protein